VEVAPVMRKKKAMKGEIIREELGEGKKSKKKRSKKKLGGQL